MYILTKLDSLPGVSTLLSYGETLDKLKFYSTTNIIRIFYLLFINTRNNKPYTKSLNKHKWIIEDVDLYRELLLK
jgi:hypothetical protein